MRVPQVEWARSPAGLRQTRAGFAALLCALAGVGCSGEISDPDPGAQAGAGAVAGRAGGAGNSAGTSAAGSGQLPDLTEVNENNPGGVSVACDEDRALSPGSLLKLSTVQYRNTVTDLLQGSGLGAILANVDPVLASIPADSDKDGFRGLDDRIGVEHVQGFFDVGVAVGDAVAADPALLEAVAGACARSGSMTDACWSDFLDGFMQRVHRRPLHIAERELYDELNDGSRSGAQAVRAALIVGLSSPRFIYHVEVDGEPVGGSEALLGLEAYEVANRLSYTFWQTMPDRALFEAAADGSLLERDVYAAELQRVWDDPRTQQTLQQFWTEWLRLDRFTGFETTRPAFQALADGAPIGEPGHDYYGDMVQEIHDLTDLFTFDRVATLASLLTTRESVTPSVDLADLYGVAPWDGSSAYPNFPQGERAGLLQRAALLVSNLEQTNPFHRGALVRTAFLCDPLAQPDPNSLPPGSLDPPPINQAQTTRERFTAKVEGNGLCATCHDSFSNIGYVLEGFDALGRYRTVERVFDASNGSLLAELPIDTRAEARIASATEAPVDGPAELNQVIVDSGKVEACLAKSYFSYVMRRASRNSSMDACVIEDLAAALADEEQGLAGAFQRLARVPTFLTRRVESP